MLMNEQINTQLIPPSGPLLASMPLGRDIHATKIFVAPSLDGDILTEMRAPPDADEMDANDDSSDDEAETTPGGLPGAIPGSFSTASSTNSYY